MREMKYKYPQFYNGAKYVRLPTLKNNSYGMESKAFQAQQDANASLDAVNSIGGSVKC